MALMDWLRSLPNEEYRRLTKPGIDLQDEFRRFHSNKRPNPSTPRKGTDASPKRGTIQGKPSAKELPRPMPDRGDTILHALRQSAGRVGARRRWEVDLDWHRKLEQLRGGTFGHWKANLRNLAVRYILLWRTLDDRKTFAYWPEAARRELLELARRCDEPFDPNSKFVPPEVFARSPVFSGFKIPLFHVSWTRKGLQAWARVTTEESLMIEPEKPRKEPSKKLLRRAAVLTVYTRLLQRYGKVSNRKMQQALKEQGIEASVRTIWKDLNALRELTR